MALTDKRKLYLRELYHKNLKINREKAALRAREWRKNNKEKARECDRKRRERHKEKRKQYQQWYNKTHKRDPVKIAARTLLNNAVKLGRIVRPKECTSCGKKASIHAHHDDYAKPLEVKWVCSGCHFLIHFPLTDVQSIIHEITDTK